MAKLANIKIALKLPYIASIEGDWKPDRTEQNASWEMYVELVTRISITQLKPDEGSLRESLTSLYSLFDTTRAILRQYGPSVAQPKRGGELSFGRLAVAILNGALRPVLAKWHPLLLDYESTKQPTISLVIHERSWDKSDELRQVLNDVRGTLIEFAGYLSQVAGVPSLIVSEDSETKSSDLNR